MSNIKVDLNNFDFNQFQQDAIAKVKSGQTLLGKEGVLTPLIKQIIRSGLRR